MKKIGKLAINAEKVIKNEELINFKGGFYEFTCFCYEDGSADTWGVVVWDLEELIDVVNDTCWAGGHCEPW